MYFFIEYASNIETTCEFKQIWLHSSGTYWWYELLTHQKDLHVLILLIGLAFFQSSALLNDVEAPLPKPKLIGLRGEPYLLVLSPDEYTLAVR